MKESIISISTRKSPPHTHISDERKNSFMKIPLIFLSALLFLSLVIAPVCADSVTVSNFADLKNNLAADGDKEITLGADVVVNEVIAVSGTKTIFGNDHTISRDSAYSGELFTLNNNNYKLVLKGSNDGTKTLTVDGNYIENSDSLVDIMGGTLEINDNVTLKNNFANNNDGGAVNVQSYGNLTMNGGEIKDCRAGNYGGAINFNGNTLIMKGSAKITNSTVDGSGGGIHASTNSIISLSDKAEISNNTASSGGGLYFSGDKFTMSGGEIRGNYATGDGGGVFVNDAEFIMTGGLISGNYVQGINYGGGGIYLGQDGIFTMSGGLIMDNSAYSGGGVSVYNANMFTMSGGTVTLNIAEDDGGGVYVYDSTFNLSGDANIALNIAEDSGGGVYIDNDGCFDMNGGEITDNIANDCGGGVYVNGGGELIINNGIIDLNKALRYEDGDDGFGGGVYIDNDGCFDMNGGEITDNIGKMGGGVYVEDGTFTMSNGEIKNNKAEHIDDDGYNSGFGGGVYVDNASMFTMSGGTISTNIADIGGGGVGVYYSNKFTMSGGKIFGNNAGEGGDGVDILESEFKISNSAEISADNEVYLFSGAVIEAESFTGSVKSITSETETAGTEIIIIANANNNLNKFGLSAKMSGLRLTANADNTKIILAEIPKQSGSSTDTGSGQYSEYPRTVVEGGFVNFGTSPTVLGVDLPKGTNGQVVLIVNSETTAPEGKTAYTVFEINIPNYPDGELAVIQFKITIDELKKAGYSAEDICLYHRGENGEWNALPTSFITKDGVAYYESVTTAFSPFAIIYEKGAAKEITAPEVTSSPTKSAEPTYVEPVMPSKTVAPVNTQSPIGLIGLVLGLAGAVLVLRRR